VGRKDNIMYQEITITKTPHTELTLSISDNSYSIKMVKKGDCLMKQKEPLKIINITQNKDHSTLRKLITEKLSKIISAEHNNT
jgi:hypothetical protein